jgi:hypothetical protein
VPPIGLALIALDHDASSCCVVAAAGRLRAWSPAPEAKHVGCDSWSNWGDMYRKLHPPPRWSAHSHVDSPRH